MSVYAVSDKTMPLHLIFWGSLLGWAAVTWRGSSTQVLLRRKKTWLWNSTRRALLGDAFVTWHIHTQIARFFMRTMWLVVIYSYQTPPNYLTPPLPVVGKTRPGWDAEDLSNHLEDGQKSWSNLNTLSLRGSISPYLHSRVTYCFKHVQSKEKPNKIRAPKLNYDLISRG